MADSSVVVIAKTLTRTGTDYEARSNNFSPVVAPYREYWKSVLDQTVSDSKELEVSHMAVLYIRNNELEEAMFSLQKAFEGHEGAMVYLRVEPLFQPLYSDHRFKEIVKAMGL